MRTCGQKRMIDSLPDEPPTDAKVVEGSAWLLFRHAGSWGNLRLLTKECALISSHMVIDATYVIQNLRRTHIFMYIY